MNKINVFMFFAMGFLFSLTNCFADAKMSPMSRFEDWIVLILLGLIITGVIFFVIWVIKKIKKKNVDN